MKRIVLLQNLSVRFSAIKILRYLFSITLIGITGISISLAKNGSEDISSKILSRYRNAKYVEIKVDKTIKSEWKTKDQVFEGKVFYSKGKFRWENETPEKNWTVYNGKTLWNIQFASPDFPGKNKVTKSTITKKNRGQILLMSLLDTKNLTEKFKVTRQNTEINKDEIVLKLEPIEKDPSVSNLQLTLDSKNELITALSFKDDIGNITLVKFKETKFSEQKSVERFEYIPNKNDEVTQI